MAVECPLDAWDSAFVSVKPSCDALISSFSSLPTSSSSIFGSCWSPLSSDPHDNPWTTNWQSRSDSSDDSYSGCSRKESPTWNLPESLIPLMTTPSHNGKCSSLHSPPSSTTSSSSSTSIPPSTLPNLMDEFLRLTMNDPSSGYGISPQSIPQYNPYHNGNNTPSGWSTPLPPLQTSSIPSQSMMWTGVSGGTNGMNGVNGSSRRVNQINYHLDECTEEYRQLEKERKQTEAELARHNLGKRISSSNGMPIPRLPSAPSRVDRLVVDFFREHARLVTLLSKMEQLRGIPSSPRAIDALSQLHSAVSLLQQCRLQERAAILQQLRGDAPRMNEDESMCLSHALLSVHNAASRVRASNWVSLMLTIGVTDSMEEEWVRRIVESDFTLPPPPIKSRPIRS